MVQPYWKTPNEEQKKNTAKLREKYKGMNYNELLQASLEPTEPEPEEEKPVPTTDHAL